MNTLSWLAGFLEGEGSFGFKPNVSVNSTDYDVILAASILMQSPTVREKKPAKSHWKSTFITVLTGGKALNLMAEIYPVMSQRRQIRIATLLNRIPSHSFDLNKTEWLAGILEGEGSFLSGSPSSPNRPRIQMASTDKDTVDLVADILNVKAFGPYEPSNPRAKVYYYTTTRGLRAIDTMLALHPYMGQRRRDDIERIVSNYVYNPGIGEFNNSVKLSDEQVIQMRRDFDNGCSMQDAMKKYGISRRQVGRIYRGECWQHLK